MICARAGHQSDERSPLEYFAGKGRLERALIETGISHAILRPTVIFGEEDTLSNNIAWFLRRLPVFGVFGDGMYRLQPIYVGDLAELAATQGASRANIVVNAIGPETFTFRGLVQTVGEIIGSRRPIVNGSERSQCRVPRRDRRKIHSQNPYGLEASLK